MRGPTCVSSATTPSHRKPTSTCTCARTPARSPSSAISAARPSGHKVPLAVAGAGLGSSIQEPQKAASPGAKPCSCERRLIPRKAHSCHLLCSHGTEGERAGVAHHPLARAGCLCCSCLSGQPDSPWDGGKWAVLLTSHSPCLPLLTSESGQAQPDAHRGAAVQLRVL